MKKINNGGETTMFVGMTDDKILNEIAFARCNLDLTDFRVADPGKSSNEWRGLSSEGIKINTYIGISFPHPFSPSNIPIQSVNYNSAFPKL